MTTICDHINRTPPVWRIPPFEPVKIAPVKRESNAWLVIATVCAAVALVSCAQELAPDNAGPDGQAHAMVARDAATQASGLLAHAVSAMPDNETPIVRTDVIQAKVSVDGIPRQLDQSSADITAMQKQSAADAKTIAGLKESLSSAEHKVGLNFEVFGLIGICAGVALAIVGGAYLGTIAKYAGMALGVAGSVAVAGGIFVSNIQPFIPYVVLGVVLLAFGFAIYYVVAHRVALFHITKTVEAIKSPIASQAQVFAKGTGTADLIQSNTTRVIVANVRASLPGSV